MIQGTTPTLGFRIKDESVNLEEANNMYVTISQGLTEITKTGDFVEIVDQRKVYMWLTQQESFLLKEGEAEAQLNWTYEDPSHNPRRAATKPKTIQITKQLLKRVIE